MKNQFEYMLIRTDPVISSITFKKHQNIDGEPLDDAVKNLPKFLCSEIEFFKNQSLVQI